MPSGNSRSWAAASRSPCGIWRSGARAICWEPSSHGHMEAVGYDLYCKMLNEAVKSLKGLPVRESYDTTIDVDIDAYIPDNIHPQRIPEAGYLQADRGH